jgi:hypothetical protein
LDAVLSSAAVARVAAVRAAAALVDSDDATGSAPAKCDTTLLTMGPSPCCSTAVEPLELLSSSSCQHEIQISLTT